MQKCDSYKNKIFDIYCVLFDATYSQTEAPDSYDISGL